MYEKQNDWSVNPQDKLKLQQTFVSLKPEDNKISGSVAKVFLVSSNLPSTVLSQIWELADTDKDGFLTMSEFFYASKLIDAYLNGYILPTSLPIELITAVNASLGISYVFRPPTNTLDGIFSAKCSISNKNMSKSNTNVNMGTVPAQELKHSNRSSDYSFYFSKLITLGERKISASKIKEIFSKSSLSNKELAEIWNNSDVDRDGALNQSEFATAMGLIDARLYPQTFNPLIPSSHISNVSPKTDQPIYSMGQFDKKLVPMSSTELEFNKNVEISKNITDKLSQILKFTDKELRTSANYISTLKISENNLKYRINELNSKISDVDQQTKLSQQSIERQKNIINNNSSRFPTPFNNQLSANNPHSFRPHKPSIIPSRPSQSKSGFKAMTQPRQTPVNIMDDINYCFTNQPSKATTKTPPVEKKALQAMPLDLFSSSLPPQVVNPPAIIFDHSEKSNQYMSELHDILGQQSNKKSTSQINPMELNDIFSDAGRQEQTQKQSFFVPDTRTSIDTTTSVKINKNTTFYDPSPINQPQVSMQFDPASSNLLDIFQPTSNIFGTSNPVQSQESSQPKICISNEMNFTESYLGGNMKLNTSINSTPLSQSIFGSNFGTDSKHGGSKQSHKNKSIFYENETIPTTRDHDEPFQVSPPIDIFGDDRFSSNILEYHTDPAEIYGNAKPKSSPLLYTLTDNQATSPAGFGEETDDIEYDESYNPPLIAVAVKSYNSPDTEFSFIAGDHLEISFKSGDFYYGKKGELIDWCPISSVRLSTPTNMDGFKNTYILNNFRRAICDNVAEEPDEVPFIYNDVVIEKREEDEWVNGYGNGVVGIYPKAFTEPINSLNMLEVRTVRTPHESINEFELKLLVGSKVGILHRNNSDWCVGVIENSDNVGFLPYSCTS